MEHRAGPLLANRSLSALIVAAFVMSAFAGLLMMSNPAPTAAQTPIGDLTVTEGTYTVENVNQPVDGDVLVSGGELIVRDASLRIISNEGVQRTVTVTTGGTITLDHGTLTTYLDQIDPWPFLDVVIDGGTFVASEQSLLSFPGTITVENGGELILYDSSIEALPSEDIALYITGSPTIDPDLADDGPVISVDDGTMTMFDSQIPNLPEYPLLGLPASNITLSGASTLLAVNSYISIDFNANLTAGDWSTHNMLNLMDTSRAHLYGTYFEEYYGTYSSRTAAIAANGESYIALPTASDTIDTTVGQDYTDLLASGEGATYHISPGELMAIDTFDAGPSATVVDQATLYIRYAVDAGYNGGRSFSWNLEGNVPASTGITPLPTETSFVEKSFDLTNAGVTDTDDLAGLDVRFLHDGSVGDVQVDSISIVISIGPEAYIYRWINLTVGDEYGVPIPDCNIDATFTGSLTFADQPSFYFGLEDGISSLPPEQVMDYLDETADTFGMTGPMGLATMPLLTDLVSGGQSPNSLFVGSYRINGTATLDSVDYSSTETFSFPAYPAMSSADQNFEMTVDVQGISAESPDPSKWLVVPPDMTIENMTYYHAGDVIVASDGTLTFRNAKFELVQSEANERTVYVDGTANLLFEYSTVNSDLPIDIIVKGEGTLEVIGSTLKGVNIVAMDHATVILDESSFDGTLTTSWDSSARIIVVDSTMLEAPVLSGSAVGEFTNSSVPSIEVLDDAQALIFRWIHVTVLDGGDNLLEGANVSARFFVNGTFWSSSVTDESGIALIRSLGTVITSDGSSFIGNYRIDSTYLSDGVWHYSDEVISVGVMPYTEPLTGNATFALLRMSTVILPDLSISSADISIEPTYVVYNSTSTINALIRNTGDTFAEDISVEFYLGADLDTAVLIASEVLADVPVGGSGSVSIDWTPNSIGSMRIWVVVNGGADGPADFDELTFSNNEAWVSVQVLGYADLSMGSIAFLSGLIPVTVSQVGGGDTVYVRALLHNYGEAPVYNPVVWMTVNYTTSMGSVSQTTYRTLTGVLYANGYFAVEFAYVTPAVGNDTEFVFTLTANPEGTVSETDMTNNAASASLTVLDIRPDFKIGVEDVYIMSGLSNETIHEFGREVMIYANVHNLGGSNPGNVTIRYSLIFGDIEYEIGTDELSVPATMWGVSQMVYKINQTVGGTYAISVSVDYENTWSEKNESNNIVEVDFVIVDLVYHVVVTTNSNTGEFTAGTNMLVTIIVYYGATDQEPEQGVAGLPGVSVNLFGPGDDGEPLVEADPLSTSTTGSASYDISLMSQLETGQYTIVPVILGDERTDFSITIQVDGVVTSRGISILVWLAILGVIIGVVAGFSAYVYFRGLGKLVECGECGAFIPAASKKCPKCGVEFEVGTMKCSECGAWVPAESAECPNCGVKFVGEEVGEEDYLEKMRAEYDEMVSKYREMAKPELGKRFSDKKFEEWWATQPTYISFDDWLAKEEEKRKEGPVPCPVCGTLNPKEATVCHKCGTVFGEGKETAPGERPPTPPVAGAETAEPQAELAPQVEKAPDQPPAPQAAPKMVIRRPIDRKVVPKKIIKTPIAGRTSEKNGSESENNEDQQ